MSLREGHPRPRPHYRLSFARGDAVRTVRLPPAGLWAIAAVAMLSLAWTAAVTLYVVFHDDVMGAVLAHEADMKAAYEDRLAEARGQLDEAASRRLLERNAFKSQVNEVISRQARLEQRGAIVVALAAETEAGKPRREAATSAPAGRAERHPGSRSADGGRRERRRLGARLRPAFRPWRRPSQRQAASDRRPGGKRERPALRDAFHDGEPAGNR